MSYLYVIKCNEFHKIGVANDVQSRLSQMQTGNPYPLEVVAYYKFDNATPIEQSIHQRFSSQWKQGEWFRLSNGDFGTIDSVCQLLGGIRQTESVIADESIEDDDNSVDNKSLDEMLASGWRVEVTGGGRYFHLRRGSRENREMTHGGYFDDLPQEYKDAYYRNKARRNGEQPDVLANDANDDRAV